MTPDADFITLTAGGNDLKYVGGLIQDEFVSTWPGWLLSPVLPLLGAGSVVEEERISVNVLAENFIAVLDGIHAAAPKAKIYLVEYLTLLSPSTISSVHVSLSAEKIAKYQNIAQDLHHAYVLASEARKDWCVLVNVAEGGREHGVRMEEPWVEGVGVRSLWRGNPMHPNEKGMRAVADMLIERLENDGVVMS
ncbi:SGNH hydrolase-type esterase domain-containing protein [Rhexocercosporidium sp. MPI-PUGE-AT-0058]|nr:SGNH hydrolase-type esterase domain-containing protein [Rhexocercosporidium sp. MPI-PUGE-AT-0058]